MVEKSPCSGCAKQTESVREGRAHYVCKICGLDKSLSDIYYFESTSKSRKVSG